jgi:hypothetical protein
MHKTTPDPMNTLILDKAPSPWSYDPLTRNVIAASGFIVCRAGDSVYAEPEIGQFLASAPDLIAALQLMIEYAEQVLADHIRDLGESPRNARYHAAIRQDIDNARAAIAKARGGL